MNCGNQFGQPENEVGLDLLERMGTLFLELEADGKIIRTNAAVTRWLGYRPEDLTGKNAWLELFPDQLSLQAGRLIDHLQTGDVAGLPVTIQTVEGSPGYLSLTSANCYDESGNLRRIYLAGLPRLADQEEAEWVQLEHLAHLGHWSWEVDSGRVHWSPEMYRLLQVEPQGLTPTLEGMLACIHPEDRRLLQAHLEQARQDGQPFSVEQRAVSDQGQGHCLQINGQAVRDRRGRVVRLLGTAQDISQQKAVEQQLVRSRDFYLTLFNQLPVLMWRAGTDGLCDYFNTSWLEFTHRPLEDELGHGWTASVHPEDRERVFRQYMNFFENRQNFEIEYRLQHHSGQYRWILDIGKPFNNLDGQFAGYIGTCYDLTERKNSEETIRQSEEYLRLVLESVNDYAIFTLDVEGHVTSWNSGAEKIKGYRAEEILGKSFSQFYTQEDQANRKPFRLLELARLEGQSEDEGWRVRKDGTRFWASIVITAVRDHEGRLRGFVKVSRDMTRRKEAEENLRRQTEFVRLLQDVAVAANESVRIEQALQIALDRVRQLTGWQIGHAFGLAMNGSSELISFGVWSVESPLSYLPFRQTTEHLRFQSEMGVPGHVLATGRPIWVESIERASIVYRQEAALRSGLKMTAAFPILAGKQVVGVLEFFGEVEASPDQNLIEVMTHIGTQLGRAVERQESELALRRSEARFRTIFEGAPVGIQFVNLEGRLLAFNPAFSSILGYSPSELEDQTQKDINHPANVVANSTLFEELRAGRRSSYRLERPFLRKDGRLMWGKLSVSVVRDVTGQPQYAIGMLEDVTDRKQMEADLAELQRRMNDGREIERLELAQDLHDGPVQDLYGLGFHLKAFAGNLPEPFDPAPVDEMYATLQHVVGTLRTICGELRPPTLAPFGLERAIRSHADHFQEEHPEIDLVLDLAYDGQELPEPVRLALYRIYQQALNNILRHSEADRVEVTLRMEPNQVYLAVQDNGKGFELPERWIELAREGHLGLVGAAERAEAIGGKLEIETAPGQGTSLRIRVPRNFEQRPNRSFVRLDR